MQISPTHLSISQATLFGTKQPPKKVTGKIVSTSESSDTFQANEPSFKIYPLGWAAIAYMVLSGLYLFFNPPEAPVSKDNNNPPAQKTSLSDQ